MVEADYKLKKYILLGCGGRKFLPFFMWIKYNISKKFEFAHEVYMKSIEELEKYLEDECYSFAEISVGKHYAHKGIVIKKNSDAYEFGYSERGNKEIIKSFSSEQELVEYAL